MTQDNSTDVKKTNRRDFIALAANSMVGIGAACVCWPLIDSMNPTADILATSSLEVDLSDIEIGKSRTVNWRGKPVFISRLSKAEQHEAENANLNDLKDPEPFYQRVTKGYEEWLVLVGICTHLGCIPISDSDGWICPCHGSYYDVCGRIMKGPAPTNLVVPEYKFLSDTTIKIG